jgi:prefoldin subunit 5
VKEKGLGKVTGTVKIGCDFFMKVEGNTEFISVETGVAGLFIDLRVEEALEYIGKRSEELQKRLEACLRQLQEVQMNIETITRSLGRMGEVEIKEFS